MKKFIIPGWLLFFSALGFIAVVARGGELTGINFTASGEFYSTNGALPNDAPVLAADGNLYGTTIAGGTNGVGVIFKDTTGGQLTVLHYFSTNTWDGDYPYAPLTIGQDGSLYGVTALGGVYNQGTIFKITTNGLFTQLYSFGTELSNQGYALDGACPEGGLIQGRDGNFYGVTYLGGSTNEGTVFQFLTNGILNTLHSFAGNGSNDDGINPLFASLVEGADGVFYGTTLTGGTNNDGTIFRVTAGSSFSTLFEFNGTNGLLPYAGLSLGTDGNLYGMTSEGGTNQDGNVFRITTNGVLTTLVQFNGTNGLLPYSGVALGLDNTIYGTTYEGGPAFVPTGTNAGSGTVFQVTTNGSLTTLYSFTGGDDGGLPYGGVFRDGMGHWFGTATSGGTENSGTVYSLTDTIDPTLAITSPAAGQHMTNALATFTGTTGDNLGCGGVWCQLNGGPWTVATTQNSYTNWAITDTLIAGANTFNAYAVGFSGNFSSTNNISVVSSNTFELQLNFDTTRPLTANGLSLNLEMSPELSGQIQASTNLMNWTTLTNFGGTGTNFPFNDKNAPDYKQRFYRAVIP